MTATDSPTVAPPLAQPPLVSVVVAVFNGVTDIETTLTSALSQDHPAIELIVIDGGSTDGTQEKVQAFGDRIACFVSERDRGIADAWNKGLARCRGEYVALLNCGDRWPAGFVSAHLKQLGGRRDVIQYGTTYMTDHGVVVGRVDRAFDPARLPDGFGFIHTSVLTSKAVYDRVGLFDVNKRIAIDSDWMLRALKLGISLEQAPVHNFMATGGVSSRHWLRGQREYLDSLVAHGFLPCITPALARRKWLQSWYLRLGLPRVRVRWKMQTALVFLAALNTYNRWMPSGRLRRLALRLAGVRLAPGAVVHQGVRLMARGRLSVGEGSVVNRGTLIDNRSPVDIGRHVSIAHDCRIYTTGHDHQAPDFGIRTAPVVVEDHAVLYAGAVLMPGVTVGRGAVVLPFSVVTRDVPPMAVVGGVPAVPRGTRTGELNYRLDYDYWFAT